MVTVVGLKEPFYCAVGRDEVLVFLEGEHAELRSEFLAERGRNVHHLVETAHLLAKKPFLDLVGAVLLFVYVPEPSLKLVCR
jgi:hypothetical protein